MATAQQRVCRPGLALGTYPERKTNQKERIDDRLEHAYASLSLFWQSSYPQREEIIERVNHHGQLLDNLGDHALYRRVADVRKLLAYKTFEDKQAIEVFALVREISGRILGMRHYDSQVLAGWVMFNGKLAEMQTGDGKTLAATLPAATAALAGVPVHIITANDYLAVRDASMMRPLYEALGLSVGVIEESLDFEARKSAYACDITYCTHKQVCFDYLRDRLQRGLSTSQLRLHLQQRQDHGKNTKRLMLRGLCYAIIDEADSVLIDEARTPLVLSKQVEVEHSNQIIYQQALELASQLSSPVHYTLDANSRIASISSLGLTRLAKKAQKLGCYWQGEGSRTSMVKQALCAQHLFLRDRDYVIVDNSIQLIDGNSGRIMPDRSWGHDLQHLVETKEGCQLSSSSETLARISYQSFFKRYLKLSGMSGTVREIRQELLNTYGLEVACIPPYRPSVRKEWSERFFVQKQTAQTALIASAIEQSSRGRAVLIGTRSVQESEEIAQRIIDRGIVPQVLNARHDKDEALIVSQAGTPSRITVATNMAGRGTDIQITDSVKNLGGLHVIVAQRNDASRIDRQLYGRCARQGDPGSFQCFVSLEDEIAERGLHACFLSLLKYLMPDTQNKRINRLGCQLIRFAQRCVERRHARARYLVEQEDKRLNTLLSFAGEPE